MGVLVSAEQNVKHSPAVGPTLSHSFCTPDSSNGGVRCFTRVPYLLLGRLLRRYTGVWAGLVAGSPCALLGGMQDWRVPLQPLSLFGPSHLPQHSTRKRRKCRSWAFTDRPLLADTTNAGYLLMRGLHKLWTMGCQPTTYPDVMIALAMADEEADFRASSSSMQFRPGTPKGIFAGWPAPWTYCSPTLAATIHLQSPQTYPSRGPGCHNRTKHEPASLPCSHNARTPTCMGAISVFFC